MQTETFTAGILLPVSVTEGERDRRQKSRQRHWGCWLCGAQNEVKDSLCKNCTRPRRPPWLRTYDGADVELGMVVDVAGALPKVGIVTTVCFKTKSVDVHALPRPAHIDDVPQRIHLDTDQLKTLSAIPAEELEEGDKEMALCDFFLCGQCDKVSRMVNGPSVLLDAKQRKVKEGTIRGMKKDVSTLEARKKAIAKRLPRERNFEEFDMCRQQIEDLEADISVRARELLPVQLFCPFCSWRPKQPSASFASR